MRVRGIGLPDGGTRILGIVGHPLEHSLSPALQTAVLRALDRNLIYLPLPVSGERLPEFLRMAGGLGVLGINVTTPFKEIVAHQVSSLDEETVRTGMVNTVLFHDGGAAGCGTDGAGILRYLQSAGLGSFPYGILGFGPTARSLAHRGAQQGCPPSVVVTRRPVEVRTTLAGWDIFSTGKELSQTSPAPPVVTDWKELQAAPACLDGAAAGAPWPGVWVSTLRPELPALPGAFWERGGSDNVLLDMNYGNGRTTRADEARGHGWRSAGGLGPLCCQAALSLSVWLREDVPVALYYRALGRTLRSLRPER